MNVVIWHVHGSWTTAFVQGDHTYLIPCVADRGPDGRGRADTWDWPPSAQDCPPEALRAAAIDLVVLQRPEDEGLFAAWSGRRAGRDVPAVWLEHNAPQGRIAEMRHPAADRDDVVVVHVTYANDLFWDCGSTRTTVITHGVVDPGYRYTGEMARIGVVVNEPVRRGRVTGTDLLAGFATVAPLDVFGMRVSPLTGPGVTTFENLPQWRLHGELARRRAYLHPVRWTSLGLALIEAMHLGLPVVALSTTEVPEAVPGSAGVVSNRPEVLAAALRRFLCDADEARACGEVARRVALERFGLGRFLADWDALMKEVTS